LVLTGEEVNDKENLADYLKVVTKNKLHHFLEVQFVLVNDLFHI
jgi:hypothetical protein